MSDKKAFTPAELQEVLGGMQEACALAAPATHKLAALTAPLDEGMAEQFHLLANAYEGFVRYVSERKS